MSIKSIKTEVTRVDSFEIKIDETIWNDEALKEWSNVFFPVENLEDLAKHLAQMVARLGTGEFYEGFGRIKTSFKNLEKTQWVTNEKNEWVVFREYQKGIEIVILSEDDDCEVEIINE